MEGENILLNLSEKKRKCYFISEMLSLEITRWIMALFWWSMLRFYTHTHTQGKYFTVYNDEFQQWTISWISMRTDFHCYLIYIYA